MNIIDVRDATKDGFNLFLCQDGSTHLSFLFQRMFKKLNKKQKIIKKMMKIDSLVREDKYAVECENVVLGSIKHVSSALESHNLFKNNLIFQHDTFVHEKQKNIFRR